MSHYYGLIEMLLVFGIVMIFATWAMISAIRQDNEEKARARAEAAADEADDDGDLEPEPPSDAEP